MSSLCTYSQDLRLFQIVSPNSGCQLSNAENVSILIINVGPVLSNASFDATYRINGGTPVVENIMLPPTFNNGSLITYTFNATADLSVPGTYSIDSYIDLTGDVNRSNDTINDHIVVSDPPSVGGTVLGSATVCSGSNFGTLVLSGFTGTITSWQNSPDGVSWTTISSTNDSLQYSNISSSTYYRAVVKSGACPQAFSSSVLISVDQPSVAGTITGNATVCAGSSGVLTLSGNTGSVVSWSSSTDNGTTWAPIANTTTTHSYSNLLNETLFRVEVKNGSCPSTFTSFQVSLLPASSGGTLAGTATVCEGANSGTLTLTGQVGNVTRWEKSTNGGSSWTSISNTTNTLNFNNLSTTTIYRAVVFSCTPEAFSTEVTITVNPAPVAGILTGATTVCSNTNSGSVVLSGSSGTISWESSNDGSNWTALTGSSSNYNYSNLSAETYYRAKLSSASCPAVYSNEVLISVNPQTVIGNISDDTTVCIMMNSGLIAISNHTGQIIQWESSSDNGASWSIIANTSNTNTFSNLSDTTLFRALIKSGVCPQAYTSTVSVNVTGVALSGTITGPDSLCAGAEADLELTGYSGSNIKWQLSSGDSLSWQDQVGSAPTLSIPGPSGTSFFRVIVSNGSCGADTSLLFRLEVITVAANAGPDTSMKLGNPVTLSGSGGLSYLWYPATGLSGADLANPVANPVETTTYNLIVTGLYQCSDTDNVVVTVDTDQPLRITNLITPNGDGINDTWIIENVQDYQSKVVVFNSNGHVLFEKTEYDNTWDATYNGKTIPDGTYYYVVEFVDNSGSQISSKGNLTVIRK